jgi:tetratricopeptide (TPR) repeat protein
MQLKEGRLPRAPSNEIVLLGALGEGTFQVHRLLAEFARGVGAEEEVEEAAGALAQTVAEMATEANESGLPAQMLPLLPHLRQAAAAAAGRGDQRAGWLYNELGYHLDMVTDYAGARATFERALVIGEAALGPNHPNVAIKVNNLGSVLHALGDLEGARAAYERALAIFGRFLGPDHPKTQLVRRNLDSLPQG